MGNPVRLIDQMFVLKKLQGQMKLQWSGMAKTGLLAVAIRRLHTGDNILLTTWTTDDTDP